MKALPDRFPSTMTDRIINILAHSVDLMIQLEMEFAHRLDAERLARALDLTLDAEPILGCRFVPRFGRPYWERLDAGERETLLFTEDESAYESFKLGSLDARAGPQVKACLWRSSAGDRLLLKVAHVASDAGGVKEIAAIVSSLYSQLAQDAHHRPAPNLNGSRGLWQVFKHVPWHAYPRIYLHYLRKTWRSVVPFATHALSLDGDASRPPVFVVRHISDDHLAGLAEYGRAKGATINDLAMSALFRAIAALGGWDGRSQLRLWSTVDLRRYIPGERGEAICNLSAVEPIFLGTDLGDDFGSTLARVTAMTRHLKANWIGLSDYVGMTPMRFLPYSWMLKLAHGLVRGMVEKRNYPNAYTNMGPVDADSIVFDARPRRAWLLPPPAYPPQIVVGLSGYAGTLTFSAGVYSESARELAAELFDKTVSELPV